MRRSLPEVPLYPVVFAVLFVIDRFLLNVEPIQVLGRPVAVAIAAALVAQVLFTALIRNPAIGAWVSTVTLLVLFDPGVAVALCATALIPLASALAARQRRLRPVDWARLTRVLNVIGLVALALSGLRLAPTLPAPGPPAANVDPNAGPTVPDVFIVLLDGYPRADTLLSDFGFDNGPFLASMEGLGFEVADQAHSNYNVTLLTFVSMFNMRSAQELIPEGANPGGESRLLQEALRTAAGLRELRANGYRVISITSGLTRHALYGADEVLDLGSVNSFEVALMRSGIVPLIAPDLQRTIVHDRLREHLTGSLELIVDLAAAQASQPRFVFLHVMSPHAPIVFGADGSARSGAECFPVKCNPWQEDISGQDLRPAMRDQIVHLNRLVLETVSDIVELTDGQAVVIVLSDHGRRHDQTDYDEMVRSLFLSYTPGQPGLFPRDTSPINVIPRLLNAYAGAELPLAPETAYVFDIETLHQLDVRLAP